MIDDDDDDNNSFSIHDLDHAPEPPNFLRGGRSSLFHQNPLLVSPRPPSQQQRPMMSMGARNRMILRRFSAGSTTTTPPNNPHSQHPLTHLHGSSSSARLSYDSSVARGLGATTTHSGAPPAYPSLDRPKALRDRTWSAPVVTARQTSHRSHQNNWTSGGAATATTATASPMPPRRRPRLSLQNSNDNNNNNTTATTPTIHNRSSTGTSATVVSTTPISNNYAKDETTTTTTLNRNRRAMSLPETDFQEMQKDIHAQQQQQSQQQQQELSQQHSSPQLTSPPRGRAAAVVSSHHHYLAMPTFNREDDADDDQKGEDNNHKTNNNNNNNNNDDDDDGVPNDDELHSPSFDYDYGDFPDTAADTDYGYDHNPTNTSNTNLLLDHDKNHDSSFQPDNSIVFSDYLPNQDSSAMFLEYDDHNQGGGSLLEEPANDPNEFDEKNDAKNVTFASSSPSQPQTPSSRPTPSTSQSSPAMLLPSHQQQPSPSTSPGGVIIDVDSDDLVEPLFLDSDQDQSSHMNNNQVDEYGNPIIDTDSSPPRTTSHQDNMMMHVIANRARLNSNDSWAMEQQRQIFIQQQIDQLEEQNAEMGDGMDDYSDSVSDDDDDDEDDSDYNPEATRRKTEPVYFWGVRLPARLRQCRPSLHKISRCVVTRAPCFWIYYLDKTKRMTFRQPTDRAILSRLNVLVGIFGIFQIGSTLFMGIISGAPDLVERHLETQTPEEEEAQTSVIRVANVWHINTYVYLIGISAAVLVLSAVLTVRVVRNVNLVGAIRYLWVLLWILPFEIFFAIGLFDYFRVTDVFVRQYWRDPSMAWFRELFCEDAYPEICQPIFLPNGTVEVPSEDFCIITPTANTLCTVPIGTNRSQEIAWCLENYNSTLCTRIRNDAQEASTNWLLAYYYCNASWALAITATLFLVVNTLEGIISKPLVQKSRESNVPAWMSLPIVGCVVFGFIFTFAQTSVLNTKSDTQINFIGPLYLVTAGLFFLASMLGWYLSRSSVLNTRHKRNKLISIWTFIGLMTIILMALIALFASSLAFSSSIVDIGLSESLRSNLACIIDTAGSCTGCDEFPAGDPRRCPQWSTEDVTKVIQAQAKASATLSAIFMLYAFSAWRFGWGMKDHIRKYQIEYV